LIEFYNTIAPQIVLGNSDYSIIVILAYLVNVDARISREHLNSNMASLDVAALDLALVALVDPDPSPFNVFNLGSQNDLSCIGALAVDASNLTLGDFAILNKDLALFPRNSKDCPSLEGLKLARTHC